jgi:polyisoprenoid-binding protein YceI
MFQIKNMLRKAFITLLFTAHFVTGMAQKKIFTKTGIISFYSKTNVEKIEAKNKKVLAVIDVENNKIEFAVLIKGFEFERALMQEHFNENYLESDKYPKAVFKGSFDVTKAPLTFTNNTTQTLQVTGSLTMHGVTKAVKTSATITIKNQLVSASSAFTILLSDYNIKVPALVVNNISKDILVNVNIPSLQEMK